MKAYLSVAEIANVTKKEKITVLRWIRAGKFGQVRKLGNEYRVPHEAFKMWWDKRLGGSKPRERQK
jgi:excisionase family DNA binding protein